MQFGMCMGLSAVDATGKAVNQARIAKEVGFDYVELPLAPMADMDDAAFAEGPVAMLREADIPCSVCNIFFPGSVRLTGPAADHPAALTYADRALARAEALGVDRVVFGSGGARNVPDGFSVAQGFDQLVSFLHQVGDVARRHGVIIVIEPLNRMESNVINTLAEGIALARQANHPAVACLIDYYHERMGGDAAASLPQAKGMLRHVHLARALGRSMPVLASEDAYAAFFDGLRAIGYDGGVSLEGNVRGDFRSEIARALQVLKAL